MLLTTEEVKKIAALCRIELTESEVEKFRNELSTILDYVSELNKVNTDGVQEISQITGLENVLRADAPHYSGLRDKLIASFPESRDSLLKIKSIL